MDATSLLLTLVFFLPLAVLTLAQAAEAGPPST
jgi:hypothetical protein